MQEKFNPKEIELVIGLGNPGEEYENTYHNVGCLFVDYITENLPKTANYKFIKSSVFMNESGKFVKKEVDSFLKFTELIYRRGKILIVHDDSDLVLGQYKLSFGSGSAGHKGVESVINALGTKDFWRLRIGIRDAKPRETLRKTTRKKAGEFVLQKISSANKKILEKVFEEVSRRLAA
ncbi:MAG TPA: aminoacyl-tRNA hydrolase [Candidatus Paceibacterota bacterium]|nr:aminoacyl-tRNA hydrolase [Candidatus Paceibacterota bacterium]